ncbi:MULTISPECIES: DUF3757 domain-containing protein [Pseudomonas]|uniref:DUF3757 domain-containing protein n=1 Tax=Pseudomonas gingeri TaxID=117681 RepID=A0A7Y8BP50_9PSED|nr:MULTISPECIES: DUF3757 domain-containing protein [Pseudomonas]MCU1741215.1 DUF3757 domain-containing protein [Pseudomonas sp. 20S_6.2_Bac1]NWB50834.1 DUF3757 domain-containing protein [Pseudomonas gingeri]
MQNTCAAFLAILTLTLVGHAYAADPVTIATCPAKDKIEQLPMTGGGYSYKAEGPAGGFWTGENETATEDYWQAVTFTGATYKDSTKAVICDYEGPGYAGIRLALKAFQDWQAAQGTDWNGSSCENSILNQCAFAYSTLVPTQ